MFDKLAPFGAAQVHTDQYLRWCRRELSMSHKEYESCGEINATGLAEACAQELEAYVDFEEFKI